MKVFLHEQVSPGSALREHNRYLRKLVGRVSAGTMILKERPIV